MKTRCPVCNTAYDIDEKLLARAHGKAQCFQCESIFDAFDNSFSEAIEPSPLALEDPENTSQSPLPDLRVPYTPETVVPDLDPVPIKKAKKGGVAGFLNLILVVFLGLAAVAQLTWYSRYEVMQNPRYYSLLEKACEYIECDLPIQRELEGFHVVSRYLAPDPVRDEVLVLDLRFINRAAFSQVLPDIQLTFFDHNEIATASRRFRPDEYLSPAPDADRLLVSGEEVDIRLLLEDPGVQVTGFKLQFL